MEDEIFGELIYEYGWHGHTEIDFFGKKIQAVLLINCMEGEEISEQQYEAYKMFRKKWVVIQNEILESIFAYYQEEYLIWSRENETSLYYPKVKNKKELLSMIELESIIIGFQYDKNVRDISLTFRCSWDEEYGCGIRLCSEKVDEIGMNNIAF